MDILDIAIAKQLAGGGGGSGTDNYNDLSNLPKINDVTLSGNKSSSALGLQSEITSENKLDSDLIDDTNQDNKFVTSIEKNTWNAKQNAIDADHKINADYVDDSTSTNKFVTATDKETWNAKQNAIDNSHKLSSDLVDDTNHTNKFVTSTEKNTWNGKQNAIDSEHKLSSSLVSFTTAEAAALASGIDSAKVAQISTNQSNILYVANKIGKNLLSRSTLTRAMAPWLPIEPIKAGTYVVSANIDTAATNWAVSFRDENDNSVCNCTGVGHNTLKNGVSATFTGTATQIKFWYANGATDVDAENAMVCTPEAWSISHDFEPYTLPNYDLTRLEAEDRASLAEVVDSGAKNVFNIFGATENKPSSVTRTINSDGTVTVSNDGTNTTVIALTYSISLLSGIQYIISGCPSGGSDSGYSLAIRTANVQPIDNAVDYGDGSNVFTVPSSGNYVVYLRIAANYSFSNKVFKPMVATKAAFGVSKAFVPYRPNYDLVCNSVIDLNDMISSFTVNSSKSASIKLRRNTSFTMLMFGFVQTIGKVHWYIESNTSTSVSVIDAMTGSAVSQSVISFAYSESTAILTISANVSGNCNFVLIRSAY